MEIKRLLKRQYQNIIDIIDQIVIIINTSLKVLGISKKKIKRFEWDCYADINEDMTGICKPFSVFN